MQVCYWKQLLCLKYDNNSKRNCSLQKNDAYQQQQQSIFWLTQSQSMQYAHNYADYAQYNGRRKRRELHDFNQYLCKLNESDEYLFNKEEEAEAKRDSTEESVSFLC